MRISVILLFLVFSVSYAQDNFYINKVDREAYVKSCAFNNENDIAKKIVWRHQEFNGIISLAKYKSEVIIYDTLGRVTKWENYNVGNDLETVTKYEYQAPYEPLSESEFLATGQLLYKTLFNYTDTCLKEQKFFYGKDNLRVLIKYNHDSLNKEVEEYKYYPVDELRSMKRYYYEEDKLVKEENLRKDSTLYYYVYYNYNSKGLLKKETYYNSQDKLISEIKYSYDHNNHKEKVIKTSNKGDVEYVQLYKYNFSGKLIGFEEKDGSKNTVSLLRYTYEYF